MQPSNLTLRIQWLGQEVKHVETNTFDVIEDCLAREGFTAAEGSIIFAACRGQQLKTHLTFHANEVANGSLIILIAKNPKPVRKHRQFPPVSPRAQIIAEKRAVTEKYQRERRAEMARLSDMAFASWELVPQFTNVAKSIIQAREGRENEFFYLEQEQTVLSSNAEGPSVEPLPPLQDSKPFIIGGLQTENLGIASHISDPAREEVSHKEE